MKIGAKAAPSLKGEEEKKAKTLTEKSVMFEAKKHTLLSMYSLTHVTQLGAKKTWKRNEKKSKNKFVRQTGHKSNTHKHTLGKS